MVDSLPHNINMCAKIATVNTSDKTLILGVRETFTRKLNIGSNWLDVRIGMYFTMVPATNDDSSSITETVTYNNYKDRFFWGIKNDSNYLPLSSGSRFVGMSNSNGNAPSIPSNVSAAQSFNGTALYPISTNGTTILSSNSGQTDVGVPRYSLTNSNGLWSQRFLVNNYGLSTQTISCTNKISYTTAIADVSMNSLYNQLTGSFGGGSTTLTWNASSIALPLPEYFFVNFPFFNNRIRITTYGGVKLS